MGPRRCGAVPCEICPSHGPCPASAADHARTLCEAIPFATFGTIGTGWTRYLGAEALVALPVCSACAFTALVQSARACSLPRHLLVNSSSDACLFTVRHAS